MSRCLLVIFFSLLISTGLIAFQDTRPPRAEARPKKFENHGETRTDPYFYLREKSNPDVIKYLESENAYTEAYMKPSVNLQDGLYKEFLSRIKQTDLSVPYRENGYWYYSKTEEGKQYPMLCRKPGSQSAPEEVMLDVNELAKGQKFLGMGGSQVSQDGKLLAYSTDLTGFREYTLYIKDLSTGKLLTDKIEKVSSPNWSADAKYIFYVSEDEAKRPYRLFRHELGTAREKDVLLYEEKDELYRIFLNRTLDRKYLVLTSSSSETSEVRCLPSDTPLGEWKVLLPRRENHRYMVVGHSEGDFFIRSNKDAKNFRLVKASATKPADWSDVIPHRAEVLLQSITIFKDYIVAEERFDGLDRVKIINRKSNESHELKMSEPTYSLSPSMNSEYDSGSFRYNYQSFVTPSSVFEYDLARRERKLLKQTEVPGGYDPGKYRSERIWVTARDGIKVPVSLVYKRSVNKDGSAPCLLYGYGSYGAGMSANFSPIIFSLLDRGVVYAIAHIRGGNEMGEAWHDNGKMMNKKNTFFDFIDCGNALCDQKFTSHDKLAIMGGSAGGLLVGATINLAPVDFCKAAILEVPFVDVINTMLDETLPLTVGEFLEWGNPKKKAEYDYMKSYCPYTNLKDRAYPAMLVRTSLNDSQVMYWEPAKYVAKLRTLKTNNTQPLLFKCNMAAGHGGASGRYDRLKEMAFAYAFLMKQWGMEQ